MSGDVSALTRKAVLAATVKRPAAVIAKKDGTYHVCLVGSDNSVMHVGAFVKASGRDALEAAMRRAEFYGYREGRDIFSCEVKA